MKKNKKFKEERDIDIQIETKINNEIKKHYEQLEDD